MRTLLLIFLFQTACFADIDHSSLADAIFKAEGGELTKHPYGILTKYKHTTPRQACLNTISTNWRKWLIIHPDAKEDGFIEFMSKTYCPIGAKNDPSGLNKHWVKNVKYFYKTLAK